MPDKIPRVAALARERWPFAISCISFVYLAAIPFFYSAFLGEPFLDFGGELYLFWRLAEGAVLYRDLDYLYGPLPPLLSAFAYSLGGRGGVITLNLVASLATLALLHRFLSRFVSAAAAAVALATIVFCFATSQATIAQNYNFFTPYKTGALLGMFFAVSCFQLAAWPLLSHAKGRTLAAWQFGAGALAAACLLSKQEPAAALAIGLGGLLPCWLLPSRRKLALPAFAWLAAGTLLVLSLTLIGFVVFAGASLAQASSWLAEPYLALLNPKITGQHFYAAANFSEGNGLVWLIAFAMVVFLAREAALRWPRASLRAGTVLVFLLPAAILTLRPIFSLSMLVYPMFSALPFAMLVVIAAAAWPALRTRRAPGVERMVFLAAALFAAAFCLKTFLKFRLDHYGFTLGPPAMMILILALRELSTRLGKHAGKDSPAAFLALLLALLSVAAAMVVAVGRDNRAKRPIQLSVRGSSMRIEKGTAMAVQVVGQQLKLLAKDPASTFTIIPEGNFFNWALERRSPLRFLSTYPDQFALRGVDGIIAQLAHEPADFLVYFPRPVGEYGLGPFHSTWGKEVFDWIPTAYERVEPSPDFKEPLETNGVSFWRLKATRNH
jgi:hypothetical protein